MNGYNNFGHRPRRQLKRHNHALGHDITRAYKKHEKLPRGAEPIEIEERPVAEICIIQPLRVPLREFVKKGDK